MPLILIGSLLLLAVLLALAAPFKKSLGAVSHAWLACSLLSGRGRAPDPTRRA
jgi:hypothetical protein